MSLPRLKLPKHQIKNDGTGRGQRAPQAEHISIDGTPTASTSTPVVRRPFTKGSTSSKRSSVDAKEKEAKLAKEADILALLNVLNASAIEDPELQNTLQAIKAALFERDYTTAFSRSDYLHAYCARWVPGRALAYRELLSSSDAVVELCQKKALPSSSNAQTGSKEPVRVVSIGGGAGSEVLAMASLAQEMDLDIGLDVTAVDCADWAEIVQEIGESVKSRWDLGEDKFSLHFLHQDILESIPAPSIDFSKVDIVTLFFTTNELFAASKPKTLALFAHLSAVCKPGTLIFVAESAGSYSEIKVGDKVYSLDFILDQTLVGRDKTWRVVEKDANRWYRVSEETKKLYPLQIENTHMLVRVYRKA